MGQKVNPIGFRLGVYRQWDSRWYADRDYTKLLHEDLAMRRLIGSRLRNAGVARIETERSANQLTVIIQTAKPGIVIGKQGASVDALRDELERISGKKVRVTIHEIKTPELDARLVAENVASQLEKRIAFRRALKQTLMRSMRAGARGVKIEVSGRLGGAEMSRREWDRDGRVPLHTLRANIDYGQAEARTTFGRIGVTCWIYKGDYVTATGEPVMWGGPGRETGDGGEPSRATPGGERGPRPASGRAPARPRTGPVEPAVRPSVAAVAEPAAPVEAVAEASPAVAAEAPAVAEEALPEVGTAEAGEPAGVEAVEIDEPVEVEDDASEDEMAELPDDGLGGERVEKLPARKAAVRRRTPAAKKPAPGGDRPAPRTEEE